MSPAETILMEQRWMAGWNPNKPIKNFFDRLKDSYVLLIENPPAYMVDQMIDKAKMAIKIMGLFAMVILDWNGFNNANQTWPEFKLHF